MTSSPVGLSSTVDGAGRRSPTVAMIGAGQLARMTHQAAVDYGIGLHVLANAIDDPAVVAGATFTLGRHDRFDDLVAAAAHGDVLTLDHELVAVEHLRELVRAGFHVRPNPDALALSCDKLLARRTFDGLGEIRVPVPAFAAADELEDFAAFGDQHGWPVVAKGRSGGYDGRGVHVVPNLDSARRLIDNSPVSLRPAWLLEEHLDLAGEFAILLARNPSGHMAIYPPIETRQSDGICHELVMPARIPAHITEEAIGLTRSIVAGIDATGVAAAEYFWTTDGRLLLNELALRPHNSGHATIEACVTSQFHQHLRAVLDWPLGATTLHAPAATVNLIAGSEPVDPLSRLPDALAVTGAHVHLYQKAPRPGRKIGHVTALGSTADEALDTARAAAKCFV